ncbi:MAG: helix-turn-helix domain-containing protein [Acidobacteria bacterium]|nr:helix-turn-helix domain-containing protein [Acidobacteriota bacterium]
MSVQAQSWVIEHSQHKGSELLLLLMIANHAHADGTNAFPSLKLLAKECRMSRRQIARLVKTLETSGELQVHRRGTRTNSYSIRMEDDPTQLRASAPDAASDMTVSPPSDIAVSPPLEPSLTVKEPSHEPRVRARARGDSANDFGQPLYQPEKIGEHTLVEFRELLDAAAPHLTGAHLEDVRQMWRSGSPPLEVIKCYNVMRMETWRTHAVTWKTVARYLPDWKFRKEKGIEPGKENTNYGKPKKIRSAKDYATAREAWLRKHGVVADSGGGPGDQPDQQDQAIAGLLPA